MHKFRNDLKIKFTDDSDGSNVRKGKREGNKLREELSEEEYPTYSALIQQFRFFCKQENLEPALTTKNRNCYRSILSKHLPVLFCPVCYKTTIIPKVVVQLS